MLAKRVIKLKKVVKVQEVVQPKVEPKVEPKVQQALQPKVQQDLQPPPTVRRVIKISKLPIPPIPGPDIYLTKAMEAFESLREYYTILGKVIPQSDIKWYHEELQQEKKEFDEFWERCCVTKACIEATQRGEDDWGISLAMNAAKQIEKKLPILETDIGPMPDYGTREFWAWCSKRKKLKEQKEAAIIAAGGTLKVKKAKKPSP
jgi:hypothetical protein